MSVNDDRAFTQFWAAFPRKVGKLAALEQFRKALGLATVDEILAGVERYKASKPPYADWCHPKTWLSQGRWLDEPDSEPVKADIRGHVPPCKTNADCLAKLFDDARKAKGA